MKTALTQLIEKLTDKYGSDNNFINEAITDAMLLKKAEKEQIMNLMNRNEEAKRLLEKCWEIIPLDSRKWNNVFLEIDEFLKK